MKHIKKLALVLVFLVAVAGQLPGPYYVYAWRESGGPTMGPWFQLIGRVDYPMGGNVVLTVGGTMVLDNRTWWPTSPTTITNQPVGGSCIPYPCKNLF